MDKIAMYKEEIYKQAKNELLKTVRTTNKVKTPDTYKGRMEQQENFEEGYGVASKLNPLLNYKDKRVEYTTNHKGSGRHNDSLEGVKSYADIPKSHRKNETESEYETRKNRNLKKSKRLVATGNIAGAAALVGSMAVPAALMSKKYSNGIEAGMSYGAIPGVLGLMGARALGNKAATNSYLKNLKPHEKEKLLKIRDSDARQISQDVMKSDIVKVRNY